MAAPTRLKNSSNPSWPGLLPGPRLYLGLNVFDFNLTFGEISPYLGLDHSTKVMAASGR